MNVVVGWANRAVVFSVAWAIFFTALEVVQQGTSWNITPYGLAWICIGVGVQLQRNLVNDLPVITRVDIAGAVRFLWRCCCWPLGLRVS